MSPFNRYFLDFSTRVDNLQNKINKLDALKKQRSYWSENSDKSIAVMNDLMNSFSSWSEDQITPTVRIAGSVNIEYRTIFLFLHFYNTYMLLILILIILLLI